MASEIHVNDVGTVLIMTVLDDGVAVDISGASVLDVFIRKPNGVSYTKAGLFYTNGTDGKLKYIAISGDFDAPGNYKLQGKVVLPGGTYYSSISDFMVYCNL